MKYSINNQFREFHECLINLEQIQIRSRPWSQDPKSARPSKFTPSLFSWRQFNRVSAQTKGRLAPAEHSGQPLSKYKFLIFVFWALIDPWHLIWILQPIWTVSETLLLIDFSIWSWALRPWFFEVYLVKMRFFEDYIFPVGAWGFQSSKIKLLLVWIHLP